MTMISSSLPSKPKRLASCPPITRRLKVYTRMILATAQRCTGAYPARCDDRLLVDFIAEPTEQAAIGNAAEHGACHLQDVNDRTEQYNIPV